MLDDRQKHITYGQAINLAVGTYDIEQFEEDSEFIDTALLRADVFYAAMVKRQAALVSTPPAVAVAQKAAQTAADRAAVGMTDTFDVPFGQEPPPHQPLDDQALPELQSTGIGAHDASRWDPTDRRCPACGLHTLVANLMDKGPRFECASRARQKNPNSQEWETMSACNYTAWG